MDSLPAFLPNSFTSDFHLVDAGFNNGRVEVTTKTRATHWAHWKAYVWPLGVDPYFKGVPFEQRVRCLSGFAAHIRQGGYGRGQTVKGDTVSTALSAIGREIALV